MKGGLGSAAIALPNGLIVGAIVAVNAVGDIIDPDDRQGRRWSADRRRQGTGRRPEPDQNRRAAEPSWSSAASTGQNTTIGLVATNARLSKADVSRLALMADDGYARAIAPSHTTGDGDTVFALATGSLPEAVNVSLIGALAADVMSEAIVRAVSKADSLAGVPAARALGSVPARIK